MYARLACNGADYAKCRRAMPEWHAALTFPTIIAEKELRGDLLGFLGTTNRFKLVEAAPLYIDQDIGLFLRSRIAVKLFETYENIMRQVGIKAFHFAAEKKNKQWNNTIQTVLRQKPYEENHGNYWYRKEIA